MNIKKSATKRAIDSSAELLCRANEWIFKIVARTALVGLIYQIGQKIEDDFLQVSCNVFMFLIMLEIEIVIMKSVINYLVSKGFRSLVLTVIVSFFVFCGILSLFWFTLFPVMEAISKFY